MPAPEQTSEKTVFISYAWEDDAFRARVKELVLWLRGKSIKMVADFDHAKRPPTQGWPMWMQHSIEDAQVVLVVCSPKYKERFEKRAEPDAGFGVTWEGAIITQDLYVAAQRNDKFYPIFPEPINFAHIPKALAPWNNSFSFPLKQDGILELLLDRFNEDSGELSVLLELPATQQSAADMPHSSLTLAMDCTHPSQKAMQALEASIADALSMPEAQHFRAMLCQLLQLPAQASVDDLTAKLDAQAQLEIQMLCLQRALQDSAKHQTIKANMEGEPHAVEKAVAALYMRAALLHANLAAIEAGCPYSSGLTLVPAHSEVLIAILAAAQHGEVQPLKLKMQAAPVNKVRAKLAGENFIDFADAPFYPLNAEADLTHALGMKIDKRYSHVLPPRSKADMDARQDEVRLAVLQQQWLNQKYFRGIVSDQADAWLQDDTKLCQLHSKLGLPFTRVVNNSQVNVVDFLGVSLATIDRLFLQFLEVLDDAKQPTRIKQEDA